MKYIIATFLILSLAACKTTQNTVFSVPYDEETLDTLTVTAPVYKKTEDTDYTLPIYNASAELKYDLLHTRLGLSFDWENEYVLGTAELELKPLFYSMDMVIFDAQNFIIKSIYDFKTNRPLDYIYDDQKITVYLGKTYTKEEKINIGIDYIARPGYGPSGGSAAITSDKGLFFINADGADPNKPRQIWTQGETENNSRWFPTFDKPNERCTQEIFLTVDQQLETLSNGKLISSTIHDDGTKTDYWKQDKPHAPYLFMVAVGDFARVTEKWNSLPLEYMVDPPYEADAKAIFNHTPEMLTFFSEILDYPYPWDKYSQIVVEDFVSGAMENTSASVFGDFVQLSKRELIDKPNDKIVAHEMFHHWFGDLVTCESWANLTLNEGFANYSEYLWFEHKYGKDVADYHRIDELNTYLYMVNQTGTHPLIHYGYHDREEMFDVHSYNKGGLVLHMLRNYIGDKAFFAALHKYLVDNQYTAVEVDELRMAFEDITGKDLNWFFNQWYLNEGHPVIEFEYQYDYEKKKLMLEVNQIQSIEEHLPVFVLPLPVAIIGRDGGIYYRNILVNQRKQKVTIENIKTEPLAILLDGKAYTLAEIFHDYSPEQLQAIIRHSPQLTHKIMAVQQLPKNHLNDVGDILMNEDHYALRLKGLESVEDSEILEDFSKKDNHSEVRAKALRKWSTVEMNKAAQYSMELLKQNIEAYPVIKASLNVLYDYNTETAIEFAEFLADDPSPSLVPVLSDLLARSGKSKYISYFQKHLSQVNVYQVFNVYGAYSKLLQNQDMKIMVDESLKLKTTAISHSSPYHRFMAATVIYEISEKLKELNKNGQSDQLNEMIKNLSVHIEDIKSKETNQDIIERYKSF